MPQCFSLTPTELTAALVDGYRSISGPHPAQATCTAVCSGTSSASPSVSVSPSSSLSLSSLSLPSSLSPSVKTSSSVSARISSLFPSSSGVPTPVITPCCPNGFPLVLMVSITNKLGGCTCLPDSFPVTWNGTEWRNDAAMCGTGDQRIFIFGCDGVNFFIATAQGDTNVDSAVCEPVFQAVKTRIIAVDSGCGALGGTATFTITF